MLVTGRVIDSPVKVNQILQRKPTPILSFTDAHKLTNPTSTEVRCGGVKRRNNWRPVVFIVWHPPEPAPLLNSQPTKSVAASRRRLTFFFLKVKMKMRLTGIWLKYKKSGCPLRFAGFDAVVIVSRGWQDGIDRAHLIRTVLQFGKKKVNNIQHVCGGSFNLSVIRLFIQLAWFYCLSILVMRQETKETFL